MRNLTFLIGFLLLSTLAFAQKTEYNQAKGKNTISAFEDFINQFPDSKYTLKAKSQLELLKYQNAIEKNTIEDLNSFLDEYPNSKYTKNINLALEPLFFKNAKETNSIESYQKYLEKFPDGKNVISVKQTLKKLRYNEAVNSNSKELYIKYLEDFPNDYQKGSITEKLAHLEYIDVKKEGGIDAYKNFIKKYPDSEHSKELSKIVNQDNPKVEFTPEKFFSYNLRNPLSQELDEWRISYSNHLYQKAKSESYSFTDEYSKYLTFSPSTQYFEEIVTKVVNSASYDFVNNANFILASEYKKRILNGKYTDELTPEKVATTELKQLKEIYLLNVLDLSIARAKEYGVNENDLKNFYKLREEITEFDKIDLKNHQQCKDFLEKYPSCPYKEVLRKEIYKQIYLGVINIKEEQIEELVFWLPISEASEFYNAAFTYIYKATYSEKDSVIKSEIISPWITCSSYKFNTLEEKLFTADLYSWFALLQLKQNNMSNAAICYLTSAAIIHTCFNDVSSKYFNEALGNFHFKDLSSLNSMQNNIEKAKVKLQKATSNIKSTRELLYSLGLASYYFGGSDFLKKLLEGIEPKNEQEEKILQSAKENARLIKEQDNTIYKNAVLILTKLFEIDEDCWPSLRAFIIYPEKGPLENILLMPRFYDYESNIEEYISNFKDDAIILAEDWLRNSDNKYKTERGYYILGYLKKKVQIEPKHKLSDDNKYWCYYNIRINNQVSKYMELLIKSSATEDKIALVLYNRIAGDDVTPAELKTWLDKEIDKKKYTDNEVLHIFYKSIRNLESKDKVITIDKMYNSYNMSWSDIASQFYNLEILNNLTETYVKEILEGSIPYKKLDLIKHIGKNNLTEFSKYVELYLSGNFYTEGDRKIIRRNLENMYTKDIVVGYNQQINYTVVNSAVDKGEKIYKALLIQLATSGLDILDFETATYIIKKRFLTDDNLCVNGAEWILKNYNKEKVTNKPNFNDLITSSQEQKSVKTFLISYFSDNPDFTEYTNQCQKLTNSDKWVNLVAINAKYGNKISVNNESVLKIANPINDWDLSTLNTNAKQRFLDIINK